MGFGTHDVSDDPTLQKYNPVQNLHGQIVLQEPSGDYYRLAMSAVFVEELYHAGQYHSMFTDAPPCSEISALRAESHAKSHTLEWMHRVLAHNPVAIGGYVALFSPVYTTRSEINDALNDYISHGYTSDRKAFTFCPEDILSFPQSGTLNPLLPYYFIRNIQC